MQKIVREEMGMGTMEAVRVQKERVKEMEVVGGMAEETIDALRRRQQELEKYTAKGEDVLNEEVHRMH